MPCTPENIQEALGFLRGAFPDSHPDVGAETIGVWFDACSSYEGDDVIEAARELARTLDRFPALSVFVFALRGRVARRADGRRITKPCVCEDGWDTWRDPDGRWMSRPCQYCQAERLETWDRDMAPSWSTAPRRLTDEVSARVAS